jgi:M6 family metalloprotease-like protein
MTIAAAIAAVAMWPAFGLTPMGMTQAHSLRGDIVWHVILCDFGTNGEDTARLAKKYGVTTLHQSNAYYESLFFTLGTHGLADYVNSVSYGAARVTGDVHGWYHEAATYAVEDTVAGDRRYGDCLAAAAAAGYTPPKNDRVYVFTAPGIDVQGFEGAGAIGGDWTIDLKKDGTFDKVGPPTALPEIAHEFGHGIGLGHSFSNDLKWVPPGQGADAEYDNQFDLMSSGHIFADPTGAFGGGPPFLDAHHLDELGWLPMSRIVDVGGDGVSSRTVTLAALTHPEASGYLLARVLFDARDQFHYYTVEFREADGWDSGWKDKTIKANGLSVTYPNAMIMINEVQKFDVGRTDPATGKFVKPPTPYMNGSYYTSLKLELGPYAGSGNGAPVQALSENGVTISLVSIGSDRATVKISTNFRSNPGWTEFGPLTCKEGYVWRAADDIDYVCVTPAARQEAADENGAASMHRRGGDCNAGYVLRAAFPGDKVCVTPAQAATARDDNARASERIMNQVAMRPPGGPIVAGDFRRTPKFSNETLIKSDLLKGTAFRPSITMP